MHPCSTHTMVSNHSDRSAPILTALNVSQAARQSAVVVLKHETSTLRQRNNFISIDFKFGVGDNVREVTNPDKVGLGPMSGRNATWGQHIRVL